ncbi:hypothetical protein N7508_009877 [Penicillium antarcticum]|uniref:uncharacterized protein n=1 Tax=Penicillium antarcticum TaxID=416450 RepID=UPI0023A34F9D|nr:uncharacterized protein N7508_009877 [Penicillium antarcticum]KAJ5295056.1 hypothetical protein N7508_009877 [Penicillium antarcticum]
MKNIIAVAAFAAGTNALVGRSDSCCFHLTATGGISGSLGQLSDGQVRVGDTTLSAAQFCLSDSIITDSEGRGCVVTSETTQFQCDEGSTGTSGFSLASSGSLEFDGSSSFIACATGLNGGDNIYISNSTSVTQCTKIQLTGDSCFAAASSSASKLSSTPYAVPTSAVPVPIPAISSVAGAVGSSAPMWTSSIPSIPMVLPSTPVGTSTPAASTPLTTSSLATGTATSAGQSESGSSTSSSGSSAAATTSAPANSGARLDFSGLALLQVAAMTSIIAYLGLV